MSSSLRYDLVIVGAGLVGGLIAAAATRRGRRVALIEAGQQFDFAKRQAQLQHYQVFGGSVWPSELTERDLYVDSSESAIGVPYFLESHRMKGVGGSTLHWGGRINRLMPTDFKTASLYGTGIDWPIGYEDLEPYYSQADWELGVSGTQHSSHPPRTRDFPNPGFPMSVDDRVWVPIAERLGATVYPTHWAINSRPYAGRSECVAYAACKVCPSGARYSADVHVAEAQRSGNCDVFSNTVARRIDIDRSGTVKSIHVSSLQKQEREISGTHYVIAAHAVESARLLLLSKCGNHSDQVGRNLMEHVYVDAGGYLPEKRFYPRRSGYEGLESLSYYHGPDRRERGGLKLEFTFERDPLEEMEGRRIWGRSMAAHDRNDFGHWLGVSAETEHLPNADSRVSLDGAARDLFGDPAPHIRLAFSDVDRRTRQRSKEIISEFLSAAGAGNIVHDPLASHSFGSHHMGTCRMSDDPDQGVVDRHCRVHGASNLFVAGGSVFPTAGAAQPSLTIAALALRLADHLLSA